MQYLFHSRQPEPTPIAVVEPEGITRVITCGDAQVQARYHELGDPAGKPVLFVHTGGAAVSAWMCWYKNLQAFADALQPGGRIALVDLYAEDGSFHGDNAAKGVHHFGPPKTRAGRRVVPLPRSVVDVLTDHAAGLAPDDLVFTSPKGEPVRLSLFRRRHWAPAVQAAGLEPLRIHDLRHTAVAFWIAAGANPNEVKARAGHTSVTTVLDRYGHLLPTDDDRVTDALDAMARAVAAPGGDVIPLHQQHV